MEAEFFNLKINFFISFKLSTLNFQCFRNLPKECRPAAHMRLLTTRQSFLETHLITETSLRHRDFTSSIHSSNSGNWRIVFNFTYKVFCMQRPQGHKNYGHIASSWYHYIYRQTWGQTITKQGEELEHWEF